MNEKNRSKLTILLFIILIFLSIIIRIPEKDKGYLNEDAIYHTLLTMKCYDETPIKVHKFLPLVSLGNEGDKNIPWGATVPDKLGNYYYTSFSPVGFVAPYIFIKIFHLPINIYSLYIFNSLMYIISFILITYIFYKLFNKYIKSKNLIIVITGLIYLFQIEVMHSQGAVFWVQSIFQVLLSLQYILFMNYENKKARIGFFIMCLIMPYTEWTGYISNFSFALVLFIKRIEENKKITIKAFLEPIFIGILTIMSFGLFSLHYLLCLNYKDYFLALKNRFFARNVTNNTVYYIKQLIQGYFYSYKYMIVMCFCMLVTILTFKEYRKKLFILFKQYRYEIIFFIVIVLENIVMLQHAVVYTYDRLKFIYILILSFYILLTTILECSKENKILLKNLVLVILITISISNIVTYKNGYLNYKKIKTYEENNNKIVEYINKNFDYSNSILCSNNNIRGYMNLLFNRGIYECQLYENSQKITLEHSKKYLVYISLLDEMNIEKVTIKDMENDTEYEISAIDGQLLINNL